MRIIHLVLGKANPLRMNGVNQVAHYLAKTQSAMGHEVLLWGITKSEKHDYPPRRYQTILFQPPKRPFALSEELAAAIDQLPLEAIVHIHGTFIPVFFRIAQRLKKRQIGYVHSSHGAFSPIAMQKNAWMKKLYFYCFERHNLLNAKAVHIFGKTAFTHLDQLLPKAPKFLLPNGQDFNKLPAVFPRTQQQLVFGFCGRIKMQVKGLDLLMEGFHQYLLEGGTGQLRIIGDGQDMSALQKLVQDLGIQDEVLFYGAKYGDEKYELLADMDVFVHPSRTEGFPLSVVEATSMGLVCLVSEATNTADYIRHYNAGIALEKNEATHIAKAMQTLEQAFKVNRLEDQRDNALRLSRAEFDWEVIAEKLIRVYEKGPSAIESPLNPTVVNELA
ncbi:MAG: glycosyltransferase [Bacteroidota bacterium]